MQNVETFECSHKKAFASKEGNGKYSIYVTKDDGNDMTIYGEAVGAEGWSKGSRLKITAAPPRQSKNGKWYQTAQSVEMLDGQVATSVPIPSVAPAASKPLIRFVREKRWKLYDDGRLYDLKEDPDEDIPLLSSGDTDNSKNIRRKLEKVLDTMK